MNVLDLFSGIGALSLGLERAGFNTIAFAEVAPYQCRVLAHHWPSVPNLGDVRRADFPRADIVTGGFPCQDLSSIGKRAGLSGARSGLYRELLRAIRLVRPRHALMENVADLLGNGMGVVLGDLAEIRFDAEWHCIPAETVGAPHERDRVWIIADTQDEQRVHEPYAGEIAKRLSDYRSAWEAGSWDEAEPKVRRMDDGPADRVDRTSALGNSVVPQIPEIIGRAIMHHEGIRA